jgi:peptidyl-prolyl cis-trans isomerase SurA
MKQNTLKRNILSILSSFMLFGLNAQQDPILMEIDGKPVTKSEFLQIYLKNNNDPKFDKASLDEYMELFKKFKLKVVEAEATGYDTIPKLVKELEGYHKQLALPYLVDSAKNEQLVKEAYEHTMYEVRASHILIRLESNASPADTLIAYNRIMGLKKRIDEGSDFADVAKSKGGSEDPSVANNAGDLGYFTAFQMVYPFEETAYNTAVGSVSQPFRTRFGYHILKVTDKRKSRGTIKTAHIMVAAPKSSAEEEIQNAQKKINELYTKLKNGENFENLAKEYSDDPGSSQKGGELPAFGSGTTTRMVPAFEDAAFALKNDGDFSLPIQTDYGFHIIKRIEWKDVKPFSEMKKELQVKVNKDERSKKTQDSYVEKLKQAYNFQDYSAKNAAWFIKNLDSNYYIGKWSTKKLKSDKVLFELDGKEFGQKMFASYLENNYRNIRKDRNEEVIRLQLKNWEKQAILDYEESKLASKYPEFKALINEYHDGILLYEIMTDKVWNKAIKDTVGLKSYFEQNRSKYMWGNRLDALVYECLNEKIANEVYTMIKNDTITSKHVIDKINKDSELNLRVKTNKFDVEQTAYLKGKEFSSGVNKPYEFNGKYIVIKVNEKLAPKMKELNEAKGAATSDYQNYLESEWLKELNKKHSIKVDESVLYSIGN